MSYHFQLRGNGFSYSWTKDCTPEVAIAHARQVSREYGRDDVYRDALIEITDEAGNALVTVSVLPGSGSVHDRAVAAL